MGSCYGDLVCGVCLHCVEGLLWISERESRMVDTWKHVSDLEKLN